jgi:hypothetical protein
LGRISKKENPAKSGEEEKMRFLARVLSGLVCWLIGRRDVRYRWLAHYLIGTGSRLYVQGQELEEAARACAWYTRAELVQGVQIKTDSYGKLFWLVGTWTAQLVSGPDGEFVRGVDRYDWHPNKPIDLAWKYGEEAEEVIPGFTWWWTRSPLPGWVAEAVRFLWPASREFIDVGSWGETAVSNGFWPFIGGTEFDTVIEFPTSLLHRFRWNEGEEEAPPWNDEFHDDELWDEEF